MAGVAKGYGVYDRYNLGEFNQKGSANTRYGSLGQLQTCIASLHGQGLQVYEDMVMNHLNGADTPETITMTDGSTASKKLAGAGISGAPDGYRIDAAKHIQTDFLLSKPA